MARIVLVVALAVTLHAAGWMQGRAAERAAWSTRTAALIAERDRAAARVAGLSEALAHAQAARAALALDLEDQADADDDAGRIALPARSLRRIRAR
ncbi:hypothetical protein CCR87_14800 [Rhodobaculum claviforme]|uniref:Uncharacterized protein n=2 Tax=Rhodobaculum claviforme TaxID=1549854 RepID=A0A934TN15_9RHOB|nr:hypothetical protein [Rhodobaculum claviforme]